MTWQKWTNILYEKTLLVIPAIMHMKYWLNSYLSNFSGIEISSGTVAFLGPVYGIISEFGFVFFLFCLECIWLLK